MLGRGPEEKFGTLVLFISGPHKASRNKQYVILIVPALLMHGAGQRAAAGIPTILRACTTSSYEAFGF